MNLLNIKSLIRDKMAESLNQIVTLQNDKEQMKKQHEKELDDMCAEFLSVIDTFEKSEAIIKERGLDQEVNASKAIKRLLNAKKKPYQHLKNLALQRLSLMA